MSGSVRMAGHGGSGDGPHVQGSNGKGFQHRMSPRGGTPTPLQRFVDAKMEINSIYTDLGQYVNELCVKLNALAESHQFVDSTAVSSIQSYSESVRTIQDMLQRDHMKVVFFGRTSNGKSTVVNAMLHSKVLPQGIGHTTRCFLQVEGSSTGDKYILTEDSSERLPLESIDQLAHALEQQELGAKMNEDTLLRVFWPKEDSRLLHNDVILLDSPGVDVSPESDSWIEKHCLDADVFVLVANAEATLTEAERKFFYRVTEKLSKPYIFILCNRWDGSASEPERAEAVKKQHLATFKRFLAEDLQVCAAEKAADRIFFISAKEMLTQRLKARGVQTPTSVLAENYIERTMVFEDFERTFETCISKSAILTKFAAHVQKGRDISVDVHTLLDTMHTAADNQKISGTNSHQEKLTELRQSQSSLLQFVGKSKDEIKRLSHEVQLKVANDFSEEIARLGHIIDNFDRQFSDAPHYLSSYKKLLTDHVDGLVTCRLVERCTGGLLERIVSIERDMVAGVSALLPSDYAGKATSVVQFRDPFRFTIAIHCHSLMEDFREDLEFRFSLGISQLIRRFVHLKRSRTLSTGSDGGEGSLFGHNLLPAPMVRAEPQSSAVDFGPQEDAMMHSLIISSASYVANGGVGLLLLGGLVYRTVGWRVIAVGASAYLGLYAYERLRWNINAKENQFKKQFRSHLSAKLKQLSHTYTMNCEHQVTREVQEVLSRLQGASTEVHQNMKNDVDKLQKETDDLGKVANELKQTKGKATFLAGSLDRFKENYLSAESP